VSLVIACKKVGKSNAPEDQRHASVVALKMFPLSAADMKRMLVL
jgi:hypothetical protein